MRALGACVRRSEPSQGKYPLQTLYIVMNLLDSTRTQVVIPTSGDAADHPLAAARAFRALDTFSYLDEVQA